MLETMEILNLHQKRNMKKMSRFHGVIYKSFLVNICIYFHIYIKSLHIYIYMCIYTFIFIFIFYIFSYIYIDFLYKDMCVLSLITSFFCEY